MGSSTEQEASPFQPIQPVAAMFVPLPGAVGQANDRARKERVARAGRVDDIHLLGGHNAALAVGAGVDRALAAHRHHHAGDAGTAHIVGQHAAHGGGAKVVVIVGEKHSRLLLVADKTVDLL